MRVNMKKQILKKIFLTLVILTLGSCSDPIFYSISQEEKPLEPLIKGSPTNFVNFQSNIYVGSGRILYRYNGQYPNDPARGDWTTFTPGGNIRQLAATNNTMYALCEDSVKYILKKSGNGSSWSNASVPNEISIQSIHAAYNTLFIGTGDSIYKYDGTSLTPLTGADTANKRLNGAAYDGSDYYLSVSGGGIYKSDLTLGGANLIGNSNNVLFMGIINLDETNTSNKIVAISRDGELYDVKDSSVEKKNYTLGNKNFATGALAIWTNPNNYSEKLLVAGRQSMEYTVNYLQGYLEFKLDSGNNIISNFSEPGKNSPSSVNNYGTYQSLMEKNPVHSLFQANDGTLFASTATNGVWSYRLRNDKWQWNAEQ
jgi:hypothetical protein